MELESGGQTHEGSSATSKEPELSRDVLLHIFAHTKRDTLLACASTCKSWRELCKSQCIWQKLFTDEFCIAGAKSRLSSNEMGGSALAYGSHSQQGKTEDAQRLLGVEGATTDWRTLYQRRWEVEKNWKCGESSARVLRGHNDYIRCAQLEGSTLVTASGSISHLDCTIRVWDLDTGTLRQLLRGHMGPIWCMVYDPASGRIASGSDDYTVRYWDAQAGNCVCLQDPDSAVRCIHLDSSTGQLVAGTEFGRLLLWDTNQLNELLAAGLNHVRQELSRINHQEPPCQQVNARRVLVDGTNHVQTHDSAEEGKAISAIQTQGGLCASTSMEPMSCIQLWDVTPREGCGAVPWRLLREVGEADMQYANSMSFEKPLGVMVAGCGDRNMRVWDLETGSRLHLLGGHTDEIHSHQFDASLLASSALNGVIRLWDLRSGKPIRALQHHAPVHAFQFDGNRLASGTWDGRVMLWDLPSGRLVKEWKHHNERVWAIAMDDYHVASAALDKTVCVRNFLPEDVRFARWGNDTLC
mmetsp:Transcript_17388/g.37549  ORF Transcript_17388/g.37549 Transcript_17388/m.37549 type:complete len:525 (-) Transcript_17388:1845-3419(-)|eukprot:CAMPEP_0202894210 /NCGR_PEP_ID=MMETSP1392-20130828/3654_1 /ASSEMBLY_ACC=CAM_ASM_000868 /TAXON_ID=225041 /ORGANISM="Chlamydomonas chlamydogama, Strain SAG 11-48b" /LENGTH=524 /DNA_ID=CAMNT_0049578829 /DNA_START=216 /DNA_END=1790 /DNA_ORIENTATION=-